MGVFKKNNKNEKQTAIQYTFITDFNVKSKKMESIIKKSWPLFLKDGMLNKILPSHLRFIYRKNKSVRSRIVKNILDPPQQVKMFPDLKGFFRCNQCSAYN